MFWSAPPLSSAPSPTEASASPPRQRARRGCRGPSTRSRGCRQTSPERKKTKSLAFLACCPRLLSISMVPSRTLSGGPLVSSALTSKLLAPFSSGCLHCWRRRPSTPWTTRSTSSWRYELLISSQVSESCRRCRLACSGSPRHTAATHLPDGSDSGRCGEPVSRHPSRRGPPGPLGHQRGHHSG